jgi:hypothetical protein
MWWSYDFCARLSGSSASRSGHLTPGKERRYVLYLTLGGLSTGLDGYEEGNFPFPHRGLKHVPSVP